MQKWMWIGVACVLGATQTHAQESHYLPTSGVTLFGLLDAGVSYVTNQGGHAGALADSGILAPNLLGFRGSEDLGGGTSAIFELVSQFNLTDGTVLPGPGALFNREAWVGLRDQRLGTLTFGNQYDFMTDELLPYDPSLYFGSFYNFRQGPFAALGIPGNPTGSFDFDRLAGTTRIPNSIKYKSPTISGLSVGALYGFSNQPGAFSTDNTKSFSADYTLGRFSLGAAYTDIRYAQLDNGHDSIRNFGFGGRYDFGQVQGYLLYTNTKNTLSGAEINVYEAGANWNFAQVWWLGASYELMDGNAQLSDNKANQVAATLSYALSKRTTLSLTALYQHASGDSAQTQAWINLLQPSSTSSQALVRIGMTTRF
jgi:predicted porin